MNTPEGWRLVPNETTWDMRLAAQRYVNFEKKWRAALNATPIPPTTNWLNVSDTMPDDETTVLIVVDGEVWTGYHDCDAWYYVSGDRIGGVVTHWMDFPAPPV